MGYMRGRQLMRGQGLLQDACSWVIQAGGDIPSLTNLDLSPIYGMKEILKLIAWLVLILAFSQAITSIILVALATISKLLN